MGRYELKYELNQESYQRLKQKLSFIMERDQFSQLNGGYQVDSLYFDTKDFEFLRQKVEGDFQHIKLRLRSYGNQPFAGPLFWEAKLKWNLWQKKLRSEVTPGNKLPSVKFCPLLPELMLSQSLEPKCIVSYYREAYAAPNLRLNFDSNLSIARELCDGKIPIIPSSQVILELKLADLNLPSWLSRIIETESLTLINFSKYTKGIERLEAHSFSG